MKDATPDTQRVEWKRKRTADRDDQEKFKEEVEREFQRLRGLDATPSKRRRVAAMKLFGRLIRIIKGIGVGCVVAIVGFACRPPDLGDRAIGSLTGNEIFDGIFWYLGLLAGVALAAWVAFGAEPDFEKAKLAGYRLRARLAVESRRPPTYYQVVRGAGSMSKNPTSDYGRILASLLKTEVAGGGKISNTQVHAICVAEGDERAYERLVSNRGVLLRIGSDGWPVAD